MVPSTCCIEENKRNQGEKMSKDSPSSRNKKLHIEDQITVE